MGNGERTMHYVRELMEGGLRIEVAEEPGAVVAGPNGAAFRRDVGAGERWDRGS